MNAAKNVRGGPVSLGATARDHLFSACAEPPPSLLLKGIQEFNEGRYWECHETLEGLWRAESRPVRDLYQGILQVGVGFHHLCRGNYAGALKVLGRGLARLERLPDTCQRVQVGQITSASRVVHARVLELGPDRLHEFDLSSLPRVHISPAEIPATGVSVA